MAFAVETSRPTIEQQHHRLSIALPPSPVFVDADSIRMAQVLSNLLNNAAKYTEPGGQIRLAVAVEGAEVVFRVRDNGIGIPAEMLSQVFDLFTQVDHSLDHSQGGLGLGLTLVRSLVEMHGGTVQARERGAQTGGASSSSACRSCPRPRPVPSRRQQTAAPAPTPTPAPEDRASAPSRRVLVVDDNVSSAQSLAMVLKLEGYDVQVAHDGGRRARGGSEIPSRSRADGHRPAGHGRLRSWRAGSARSRTWERASRSWSPSPATPRTRLAAVPARPASTTTWSSRSTPTACWRSWPRSNGLKPPPKRQSDLATDKNKKIRLYQPMDRKWIKFNFDFIRVKALLSRFFAGAYRG